MRELTLHERIRNADASQQVENVKAKHAYLHGRADATGEWSVIWSRSDDCSWAHAFGRMRGFDQVYHGSVGDYDRMCMENWLDLYEVYPEVTGKDPRPLMECSVHTLVTDVIEVAADGQSARGCFITPGVIHSRLTADKGEDGKVHRSPQVLPRSVGALRLRLCLRGRRVEVSARARLSPIWWATWITPTGLPMSTGASPIPTPVR